ncbi:MAG: NAD(P)H-dependent oxidoreductase [Betaproteobacteria bacterium]|nr:NAD(P)H-dependent oxidoreductase [Betaproteobacteria bacterium]
MILLIHAHPYPSHSRGCRALLGAVREVPGLEVRSLYDLYPTFDIDVPAEQAALARAALIVWLHPTYWYSVPGLMKHWFDVVLTRGWAYGKGGDALAGKPCLWATTTGGQPATYAPDGLHRLPFDDYHAPVEMTARFCGMQWLAPFVLHGAHSVSETELAAAAQAFRARIAAHAKDSDA